MIDETFFAKEEFAEYRKVVAMSDALDTAERRKKLLRRLEWVFDPVRKLYVCLFCDATARTLEWAGIMDKHADDCELAKELKDE